MSELADAPANIFSMFNNADIRFPDVEDANGEKHTLTIGSYISYMRAASHLRRTLFMPRAPSTVSTAIRLRRCIMQMQSRQM